MALAKDQIHDLAKVWLLKSVSINPWNWGAWQELCSLVRDARDVRIFASLTELDWLMFFSAGFDSFPFAAECHGIYIFNLLSPGASSGVGFSPF